MLKKILTIIVLVSAASFAQNVIDANNQYMLAQSYMQEAQYEKAKPILEELYKSQPSNYVYFQALNETYTNLKDYDASIALLEQKIANSGPNINLYGMLGTTYYLKGNENKAFETWDDGLKKLPSSDINYRVIANFAIQRRAFDKAIEYLRKGQDISANPILFAYDLANLYSLTMQFKNATEEYCFILSKNPSQLNDVEGRILNYISKPDALDKSLAVVKKYAEGKELGFKYLLARLYVAKEDYDKAYKIYQDIDSDQKDNGAQLFNFAQFLYGEKIYKIAAQVYGDILSRYPESPYVPNAKLGYAKTLDALLDVDSAAQEPVWKPFYQTVVNDRPEIKKVIDAYEEIIKIYPHSEVANEAYLNMGNIKFVKLNDPVAAQKDYERIIEDAPLSKYSADAYDNMGKTAMVLGDLSKAAGYFTKVASNLRYTADQRNEAFYRLARISFYNGDLGKAKDYVNKVLDNMGNSTANDALELSLLMNTSQSDSSNLVTFASAELLADQKKFKEAAEKYLIVAGDHQKLMLQNLAMLREAEMQLAQNNIDSTVTLLEKIENEGERNMYADKAAYLLGQVYQFALNDKAKAVSAYENLLAKFPNSLYLDKARAEIIKLRDKLS